MIKSSKRKGIGMAVISGKLEEMKKHGNVASIRRCIDEAEEWLPNRMQTDILTRFVW